MSTRTDITIPTAVDPEVRKIFLQLLERVKELERTVLTEDQLVQKRVLRRTGTSTTASVLPTV